LIAHLIKASVRKLLIALGLWPSAYYFFIDFFSYFSESKRRLRRKAAARFQNFKQHYFQVLSVKLTKEQPARKALVMNIGSPSVTEMELVLIKGLELGNFKSHVWMVPESWADRYQRLNRNISLSYCDTFPSLKELQEAGEKVNRLKTFEDLLAVECLGARVGRFAASTALRKLRVGMLDIHDIKVRKHLTYALASAIAYAKRFNGLMESLKPDIAIFGHRGYTPHAEAFDICIEKGIPAVTWNVAHKNNTLMFKRYYPSNRDEHHSSLSNESWQRMKQEPWSAKKSEQLLNELKTCYENGEWYSEVGTQVNKKMMKKEQMVQEFSLDPNKKIAVIFSHILWDGTFFWGEDLFRNYEDWLIETVKAAAENKAVNWLIKVHPANMVKDARDGCKGEPSEVTAIKKHIGRLPSHIKVVASHHPMNTFSLFETMDYCVTVRGTIGIEAASFGIPVLTAGTGRYDRKGFTCDSENQADYLYRIKNIHQIKRLSSSEQELAERFGFGVFLKRPLPIKSFSVEFDKSEMADVQTHLHIHNEQDWRQAADLRAFADWIAQSRKEDFLTEL